MSAVSQRKEEEKCLEALIDHSNASDILKRNLRKRVAGTCEWAFTNTSGPFQEWCNDSSRHVVALIGDHGCGKTVTTAAVIGHLERCLAESSGKSADPQKSILCYFSAVASKMARGTMHFRFCGAASSRLG